MNTDNMNKTRTAIQDHFLGISILIGFLLPHSNTLFLLVNPLLCLLGLFVFNAKKGNHFVFIVLIPIILSLLLNFQEASSKAFLSTFTILLLFACFPIVDRVRVRNSYLFICLLYILTSQLVYLLNIQFMANFYDSIYPIIDESYLRQYEYMQSNISYETVLDYRLGGLFHNSNDCSRYLTMLLAFYLSANQNKTIHNSTFFIVLTFLGIFLTGSRTGFLIGLLIVYFGFLRNHKFSIYARFLIVGLIVVGLLYLFINAFSYRAIDINEGIRVSLNAKWKTFLYYIQNESSLLAVLFGHLDVSLFNGGSGEAMSYFDSEYGSLIFRFGFVGFSSIIIFYWQTIKRIAKNHWFFFLVLLWMISSTIVASYRAFFIFMLLMSAVYSNNRVQS